MVVSGVVVVVGFLVTVVGDGSNGSTIPLAVTVVVVVVAVVVVYKNSDSSACTVIVAAVVAVAVGILDGRLVVLTLDDPPLGAVVVFADVDDVVPVDVVGDCTRGSDEPMPWCRPHPARGQRSKGRQHLRRS